MTASSVISSVVFFECGMEVVEGPSPGRLDLGLQLFDGPVDPALSLELGERLARGRNRLEGRRDHRWMNYAIGTGSGRDRLSGSWH